MHELTNLDLVIIVLYMIGMLFVGVWFVKRIKNTGDYYVAGRTLGPFVLTAIFPFLLRFAPLPLP